MNKVDMKIIAVAIAVVIAVSIFGAYMGLVHIKDTPSVSDYWWTMESKGGPYNSYSSYGVCVDDNGFVYNSDDSGKIYKVNPSDHTLVDTITVAGVSNTRGITWIDGYLYVNVNLGDSIAKVDPSNGNVVGYATSGNFYSSLGEKDNHLLVADAYNHLILEVDTEGNQISTWSVNQWTRVDGLAYGGGYFWIADGAAKKIYKVDTSGNRVETWDAFGDSPGGLAYDNGYLWHTDWSRYKVWKLDMGGMPPSQYTLTTNVVGSGAISPFGGTYDAGTTVTLTATPSTGWAFDHWGGDATGSSPSVTITMSGDKTVTAYFVEVQPDQFTLTLASNPPEGGTITATPSGGTYDAGTTVTLTAVPNNGYAFKGWTGTGITDTTSLTTTVTINSDMTVTAHFEKTTAHMWWLLPLIVIIVISGAGAAYYIKKKH